MLPVLFPLLPPNLNNIYALDPYSISRSPTSLPNCQRATTGFDQEIMARDLFKKAYQPLVALGASYFVVLGLLMVPWIQNK